MKALGIVFSARPFIYYEGLIFSETSVNGKEGILCLLDTGASVSAIDIKTAESLGLPILRRSKVEGTDGTIDVEMVRVNSLSIGEAQVSNLDVTKRDLSFSISPDNRHLDVILGYDFLRHFSVDIDFTSQQIGLFSKRTEFPLSIPFQLDNGIPKVSAVLNNSIPVNLRLDTGASLFKTNNIYINITMNTWEQLTVLDTNLKPETYFSAVGLVGQLKLPVARINSLSIGKICIQKPYIIVQHGKGYFARPDAVGFISNNFLEKFHRVIIDYISGNIHIANQNEK